MAPSWKDFRVVHHGPGVAVQCTYCLRLFPRREVLKHERMCELSPIMRPKTFRSLGKTFMVKPERPQELKPPAVRIAIVVIEGKSYFVMLDDIQELIKVRFIRRDGDFRHNKLNIYCFKMKWLDVLDEADVIRFDQLWAVVKKAKKAGTSL